MPRFNSWIVAIAVLAALVWLSPEQFEPNEIRRTVGVGAALVARNMRRMVRLVGDGLRLTGTEFTKLAAEDDGESTRQR